MLRYSDDEITRLMNDLESDLVERKQSFRGDTPKKARQAVCAFANDLPNHNLPGVLFIGVDDGGNLSHEPITDGLLLSLADMKTDGNTLPLPVMSVEKRSVHGGEVAVVTVMPSDTPPVKYEGRIWVRTGPRRSIANEQDERILIEKRRYKNLPFDIYPVPSATIIDLSRLLFENEYLPAAFAPDILSANNRTYEERLASCRMIVSPENTTPTVLGILTLGKNPQDFISGAHIQFLRIDGTELADPVVDADDFEGTLPDMLRRAEEKMASHNRTAVDITSSPTHTVGRPYPPEALQQVLYNAVLHRTYESTNAPVRIYWFNDRIEVSSPGGPFGNVTQENFGNPGVTDYRNPNIADVLKTYGYIQAFGRGIPVANRALTENGNRPLQFEVNQSYVLCTIWSQS